MPFSNRTTPKGRHLHAALWGYRGTLRGRAQGGLSRKSSPNPSQSFKTENLLRLHGPGLCRGDYYRIPCDTRDLNYDKFFTEGNEKVSKIEDYHSHNTVRLDIEGMKEQLMRLRFVQADLGMIETDTKREIRSE